MAGDQHAKQEQRVSAADEDQFGGRRARDERGQDVAHRGEDEDRREERVHGRGARRPAERRGRLLPLVVKLRVQVAPDALDADVQGEDGLERRGEDDQRDQRRDRRRRSCRCRYGQRRPDRGARGKHPHTRGATFTNRRAECGVFLLFARCHADIQVMRRLPVAHCGTALGKSSGVTLCSIARAPIRSDNPLAICDLSATLFSPLPVRIYTDQGLSA